MRLSLIICTYRRARPMATLLKSLRAQVTMPEEVLVVDASPDDDTERVVLEAQRCWPRGELLYFRAPDEHRGLTRQRNYGIARARGEIVAFLDDDTSLEPDYFAELLACFTRHPEAVGVGGFIANEVAWQPANGGGESLAVFRRGGWERREDVRWRVRKAFGLVSPSPPGWMPPGGHGRPVGFVPPDGEDHEVEFFIGAAFSWRREVFEGHQFSHYFEGYGLYEDMDFCLRAARDGKLFVCTRAKLAHYHAASGRPDRFKYGEMVVRNGWYVWRLRWPSPAPADRSRWWATTILLTLMRAGNAAQKGARREALSEATGRVWGMLTLLWDTPGGRDDA